tara:strand:- start:3001 stop:3252 length:252 start_codon:yes stop_codon:yes gene_type:complete
MENAVPQVLSPAEKLYQSHLINVKNYQRRNPEKMKAKAKQYMNKLKEDPEKYEIFLEKRRDYYNNVVKPKKEKTQTQTQTQIK